MSGLVPLQALPPEVLAVLLEQGGPTAVVVGLLWWRLNRMEERFADRMDDVEEDVSANSGVIYDRLLADGAGDAGDGWD